LLFPLLHHADAKETDLLRISASHAAADQVVLHLEGEVIDPWCSELERVVTVLIAEGKSVVLELSGVRFIDSHGADLLHEWRKTIALMNRTPFVNELLKARQSQSE
jgi:anti-anti-sigma regulatory factor